jgi:hypothetical protein
MRRLELSISDQQARNIWSNPSSEKKAFHYLPSALDSIPRFDPNDPAHLTLAQCGREYRIAHGDSGEKVTGSRKQALRTWLSTIGKMVESLLK